MSDTMREGTSQGFGGSLLDESWRAYNQGHTGESGTADERHMAGLRAVLDYLRPVPAVSAPVGAAGGPLDRAIEAMWCEALLPEGTDVIERVTTRFLAARAALRSAPPTTRANIAAIRTGDDMRKWEVAFAIANNTPASMRTFFEMVLDGATAEEIIGPAARG